ncbi:lipoprotein [Microbacterium oryzae]|uniref:ABC transporter n=1 Tax=Microbacterium oryzae TaxID=743009 RepID=A0A6I6E1R5_9MICO|nr:ABC transporter [Microbacterium oryzae]QGU28074.1 ABC transporter [Microbacterium oryzae]
MSPRSRPVRLAAATAILLITPACATIDPVAGPSTSAAPSAAAGHGEIAGAAEVAEPPLQLVSVDESGALGALDLLDGTTAEIARVGAPEALASDGRYLFVTTDAGVEIVDSGAWTWDHVDHFHYYRAEPRTVGTVDGAGPATVSTGLLSTAGATGIFLSGSGQAVLLDNAALGDGRIDELFRIETGAPEGVAAPLGGGALVSAPGEDGGMLRFHEADGAVTPSTTECVDAQGSITTRVGLVVGCADGAVLATMDRGEPVFERIPYPADATAERAIGFDGRKGRPTVAAIAGDAGLWLLDTREREWTLVETDAPLLRVAAVDDADGHVVALDTEGRVRVLLAGTGEEVAVTEPLLPETLDADALTGVSLTVDAQRAYLSAPTEGVAYEIAYADGARIARTLETPTEPAFLAEVGR